MNLILKHSGMLLGSGAVDDLYGFHCISYSYRKRIRDREENNIYGELHTHISAAALCCQQPHISSLQSADLCVQLRSVVLFISPFRHAISGHVIKCSFINMSNGESQSCLEAEVRSNSVCKGN